MKQAAFYIFMLYSGVILSQDFSKDIAKAYSAYKTERICFNIKYVLHESHKSDSRIISAKNGSYVKSKDKTLSKYDHLSTLTASNKIIVVDGDEKNIRIKKFNKDLYKEVPDFISQFKDFEKSISKTYLLKSDDPNILCYSVELKKNGLIPVSKYEIFIDKKNYYIVRMSLYYLNKLEKDDDYGIKGTEIPRLDILFSDFNDKKVFDESEFSDAYYYIKAKGKLLPSVNYKNYVVKEDI